MEGLHWRVELNPDPMASNRRMDQGQMMASGLENGNLVLSWNFCSGLQLRMQLELKPISFCIADNNVSNGSHI